MIGLAVAVTLTCVPVAIDGDTLKCGDERIRLMGIDAPEMPGSCAKGRTCVEGDAHASKASLQAALNTPGPVEIRRFGKDHYGRTIAMISVNGNDLSCWQIKSGRAIYVEKWDKPKFMYNNCSKLENQSAPHD